MLLPCTGERNGHWEEEARAGRVLIYPANNHEKQRGGAEEESCPRCVQCVVASGLNEVSGRGWTWVENTLVALAAPSVARDMPVMPAILHSAFSCSKT